MKKSVMKLHIVYLVLCTYFHSVLGGCGCGGGGCGGGGCGGGGCGGGSPCGAGGCGKSPCGGGGAKKGNRTITCPSCKAQFKENDPKNKKLFSGV